MIRKIEGRIMTMRALTRTPRRALTLMELVVVLVILVILAGIVVPLVSFTLQDAHDIATRATMKALRDAVLAYHRDMKGVDVAGAGTTGVPLKLIDLQVKPKDSLGNFVADFDPISRRGWRGPYVMQTTGSFQSTLHTSFYPPANSYGSIGEAAFLDGWGNPIVLQWPTIGSDLATRALNVRLLSAAAKSSDAGNNAYVLDTPSDHLADTLTHSLRGNDVVMFLFTQDPYP